MNEALNDNPTPVTPTGEDMQAVVQAIDQLTEIIVQQQETEKAEKELTVEEEKTVVDLLTDLNETLTPTEEDLVKQEEMTLEQATTFQNYQAEMATMNQSLTEMSEHDLIMQQQQAEGFFMVAMAIIISLAVKTFFDQITKW